MNRTRVAVVGCGHLGSIHARLLRSIEEVELVGVVDPVQAACERVAAECGTKALADVSSLIGSLDAAVIATPTAFHHEVAEQLLNAGTHLLIEKPITNTVAEANRLIALARRHERVLQVGHVERFNPAWNAVLPHLHHPQYIEAVRAGTYTFRSTDVSIVLDLMIHDLDLVLSLANSAVVDVEAMGMSLFGPQEDLAMARIRFANGCVANLKASRVNYEPLRTMQVYSCEAFASLDFAKGEARLIRPSQAVLQGEVDLTQCPVEQRPGIQESMFRDLLCMETVQVEKCNAILQEQREFVAAIRDGSAVRVTGEQGRDALSVAEQIVTRIRSHRWNAPIPQLVGSDVLRKPLREQTRKAA